MFILLRVSRELGQTAAAISTGLYVTGDNYHPSFSWAMSRQLHLMLRFNITDMTGRQMIVNTNTDAVKDGYFTLDTAQTTETVWAIEITVALTAARK